MNTVEFLEKGSKIWNYFTHSNWIVRDKTDKYITLENCENKHHKCTLWRDVKSDVSYARDIFQIKLV